MSRPALLLLLLTGVAAADEPRFIGDFEALDRDEWRRLVGRSLVLEGRYSTASRGEMRFSGSSLRVTLPTGVRPRRGEAVRVRGRLDEENGRPVLRASKLESIPDIASRLTVERSRLRSDESDGWLELADRYKSRAAFYDDASLAAEVREIELRGLEALSREADGDAKKLAAVAAEAKRRGFPDVLSSLAHEALRRQWAELLPKVQSGEAAPGAVELFLDRATRDLPGAGEPEEQRRPALEAAYDRDPGGAFDRADAEQRWGLARSFYAGVVADWMAARLRPDGANADDLAEEIARILPDRPELAAEYRERAVATALENLSTMTEAEATALSSRLKAAADARAGSVLPDWLAAQRAGAESRGPAALVKLAEDYERLVRDEETAAGLLRRAHEIDPRLASAERALVARGWELVGGQWRKKRQLMPKPAAAGGETEVRKGMSQEEALAVLRTLPEETLRMASVGRVTEVWIYRDLSLVVTLHRNPVSGQAVVHRVSELK